MKFNKLLLKIRLKFMLIILSPMFVTAFILSHVLPDEPWKTCVIASLCWVVYYYLDFSKRIGVLTRNAIKSTSNYIVDESRQWLEEEDAEKIVKENKEIVGRRSKAYLIPFIFGITFPSLLVIFAFLMAFDTSVVPGWRIVNVAILITTTAVIIARKLPIHYTLYAINSTKSSELSDLDKKLKDMVEDE